MASSILHSPTGGRANRLLTNKIIEATKEFLEGSSKRFWHFSNTSAVVAENGDFVVNLFDRPILKLSCKNNVVDTVHIYAGGYYDRDGNPTDLTRERLNGLLEFLGSEEIIPRDVRVWYDWQNSGLCYVIRFEEKIALNRDYAKIVSIKAIPDKFIFCGPETITLP